MTTTPQPASRPERIATAIGIALLATGAATLLLSIGFDLRGFGGGFVQGVGIGAMLVGTYLWGFGNGTRRARRRQWLPSRGTVE
ncbi:MULTISPECIES: hypothetical protein [Microbacterium]|jgi:hypothetical protein|uniref:Uncharacterized protein n=1 Tax=Microbacterium maritypicum TaxID=33918 RepID=A0AAD3X575_MICMQ|nr:MULTISPECIES: hypothetical protein [Microbacterium]AZS48375.1 hypothetical protein CVS53_03095 [Microbacterium oxydans]KAB1886398.1 hypothetical protein F6W70_02770 [Microbacterium liquefaciens]KQV02199.1 hypothetical protein ASC55_07845 [Microbacterium sp. Root322]WKT89821.1 hypothetical protein QYR02_02590 [Microbacterium liquefaciens]